MLRPIHSGYCWFNANRGSKFLAATRTSSTTLNPNVDIQNKPKKCFISGSVNLTKENTYFGCLWTKTLSQHHFSHPLRNFSFENFRHFSSSSREIPSDSRSCWKCGRNTDPLKELFFCECGIVQKIAPNLTYFDLLQEDQTFDLDAKVLGVVFRDTQKLLHPDMFSSKSKEEQQLAEEQSSLLNKAYQTLLKPMGRALYMLKLHNINIDEKDTISDPEFLMDIMSINEQIGEASSVHDLDSVEVANNESIDMCIKEISEAFRMDRIEDAKSSTIKLRYYTTIQERIFELRRRELG